MGCLNSKYKKRPSRQEGSAPQSAQGPVLQIPETLAPVQAPNQSATTSTAILPAATEAITRSGHAMPIAQNSPSAGGTTTTQQFSAPRSHYSPPGSGNTASPSAIVQGYSHLRPSSAPRPHYVPDTHGAMSRSSASGPGITPGPPISVRTSGTASTVKTNASTSQGLALAQAQEFQATQQAGRGRGRGRG
jgi:hypothetical protein